MFEHTSVKYKLIVNAILLVVGAALYASLWYGTEYVIGVLSLERAKSLESHNVTARVDQLQKVLLDSQKVREQVNGYIISDDAVVNFIEELEDLAHRVGIDQSTDAISEIGYPGLDASKWGGLRVVLSVKGSWTRVYQFLVLLEHLPYRADLVNAILEKEFTKEGVVETGGSWKGEFTLHVLKHQAK